MGDAIPTEPPDGGAPYANRTVTQVAGAVASPGPGPAGGSVAAIAGALAASLVQLAATVSREWPEAAATRERASQLEGRLLALADADAAAWVYALRHGESAEARLNARTVPAEIAAAALELERLATAAVDGCTPHVRADATTAVLLAHAAQLAALEVVAANEPR